MKGQGSGLILTMGWIRPKRARKGTAASYSGGQKRGHGFCAQLRRCLRRGCAVNCLCRAGFATAWGEGGSHQWRSGPLRETPLARWGLPRYVAATAKWLASPDGQFISGQSYTNQWGGGGADRDAARSLEGFVPFHLTQRLTSLGKRLRNFFDEFTGTFLNEANLDSFQTMYLPSTTSVEPVI